MEKEGKRPQAGSIALWGGSVALWRCVAVALWPLPSPARSSQFPSLLPLCPLLFSPLPLLFSPLPHLSPLSVQSERR